MRPSILACRNESTTTNQQQRINNNNNTEPDAHQGDPRSPSGFPDCWPRFLIIITIPFSPKGWPRFPLTDWHGFSEHLATIHNNKPA